MDGDIRYTIFMTYLTIDPMGKQVAETEIMNTTGESLADDIIGMLATPGGGDPEGAEILTLTVNLSTRQAVAL